MENLKAIIVFLLFSSIVIWCARIMKRKDKQQYIEFRASLPEMETVTDAEEREYISRVLKIYEKFWDVILGFVLLFNLWIMVNEIINIWREWSQGIAENLLVISCFIIWTYFISHLLQYRKEKRRICKNGEIKKKIVFIKAYESKPGDSMGMNGIIEGKVKGSEIKVDICGKIEQIKKDGNMAILVWLENDVCELLPRMKSKGESNTGE